MRRVQAVPLARLAVGLTAIILTAITLLAGRRGVGPAPVPPYGGGTESRPGASGTSPHNSTDPARLNGATKSDDPAKSGDPVAPDPRPAPAGFYPSNTSTGIAEVDRFIGDVMTGSTDRLLARYASVELPCSSQMWVGAPLCPGDQPAGTKVEAYPYAYCNVDFVANQRELKGHIETALHGQSLFAVYRTGTVPVLDALRPAYAVVLGRGLDDGYAPTVYLDTGGNLLLLRWGCGTPDLAVPESADVVLAPRVTAAADERGRAEAGLASVVSGEVQGMYAFLGATLGISDPCGAATGPCDMDTNFTSVVPTLIIRCDKVGPEAQMSGYAYNDQRLGPLFRPYRDACNVLRVAVATFGPPAETPEWKASALQARQILEPAMQYVNARTPDAHGQIPNAQGQTLNAQGPMPTK